MKNESIENYINILLDEKEKANVISKKSKRQNIEKLVEDTIQTLRLIKNNTILDIGSGNGIIGVPTAIIKKNCKIVLIEPRIKKSTFLKELKNRLEMKNVEVVNQDFETYIKKEKKKNVTWIIRGFPNTEKLVRIFKKQNHSQMILISSKEKIEKIIKEERIQKYEMYDIKGRDIIKVLCLENVSRETL